VVVVLGDQLVLITIPFVNRLDVLVSDEEKGKEKKEIV